MNEKTIKVLLVEGDADETAAVEHALSERSDIGGAVDHFAVTAAPRLNTASHFLAREEFDAVLLDVVLPRSVGLESFRKLRAQKPGIPLVVLTGLRDRELAEEAVRQGAQDYVVKGTLGVCVLKRVIRHAVERQRLTNELERLRGFECVSVEAQARDALMSRVSHELRNAVTTVKAAVYCLSDGLPDALTPKQRQLVQMISRNVDRQVRVMDNVLDLSRLRSGRQKMNSRPVDLAALLGDLARETRARGAAPLALDLPSRLPAVQGDPDALAQLLRNLIDNAFRHAAEKVAVRVLPEDSGGVVVTVCDDGPGIPPERIKELFADFVQLEKSGVQGPGLSLAICREIVERHGGRIWAENAAPGTRFHVRLPRAGQLEARAEPSPSRRKHPAPALTPILSQPVQQ